jgi:hypothetical protein
MGRSESAVSGANKTETSDIEYQWHFILTFQPNAGIWIVFGIAKSIFIIVLKLVPVKIKPRGVGEDDVSLVATVLDRL